MGGGTNPYFQEKEQTTIIDLPSHPSCRALDDHSPLNSTISSVSVLQITSIHTESLVEGAIPIILQDFYYAIINNSNRSLQQKITLTQTLLCNHKVKNFYFSNF